MSRAVSVPHRVVAIDGPAASGKSSTARAVAGRLGFHHLNSGLLYRAMTWRALREGWQERGPDLADRIASVRIDLVARDDRLGLEIDGRDPGAALFSPEVTERVSAVSSLPEVREAVLDRLREAGRQFDLVCDGRDIGTTVFPEADLKIFLVADPRERARRRLKDLGIEPSPEALAEEERRLIARDRADASRALSPLQRAADAIEIDTTHLAPEAVLETILALARARGIEPASRRRDEVGADEPPEPPGRPPRS